MASQLEKLLPCSTLLLIAAVIHLTPQGSDALRTGGLTAREKLEQTGPADTVQKQSQSTIAESRHRSG